ncbi:MAG: hypothetical protein V4528_04935 [Pseudomonadota bacterium]
MSRKDIFSPPGLFVIACFQAFGLNIPFFAAGYLSTTNITQNVLFTGDASMGDGTLVKMMVILLLAELSFIVGYLLPVYKLIPLSRVLNAGIPTKKVTVFSFLILAIVVVVAGFIRIKFHLGEAGIQPTIEMAGYLQYILYNGVLLLCLYYLTQGMRQGSLFTFLGLVLILAVAATQVLLSWRGGIVYVLITIFFIFWNNQIQYKRKKMHPLVWLLCLIILVPSFIQYGNSIRAERLGGSSIFATSKEEFVLNILNRSQGSTRLAVVVNDIGPLSLTHGFMFIDLFKKNMTTTRYIDQKLYGVLPYQSNSFGTSGPGGPYVAFGLLGVIIAFALYGALYRSGYECMKSANKDNVLGIVWYAMTALLLFDILSENINISNVKLLIALSGLMFIFGRLFLLKRSARSVDY